MHLAYLHYLYGDDTAHHHVRQFAEAARDLGHRVDVHGMNLGPPDGEGNGGPPPLARRLRDWLKKRLGYLLHEPKELFWNLRYLRRETELLAPEPPDVLLVRDHALTASCVPVARRLGVPLVLEVNAPAAESGLFLDQYLHLPWIGGWLEGWKLRRADGVTVVSTALEEHLVARHRIGAEKVAVVPNGADLHRFHPGVDPDPELPADFRGRPVVGFVGSFHKWHGTELLGRMARAVGAARADARFLFVGDGPEAGALHRDAAELGDRAAFTGRVPHARVPGLVAAFDVGAVAAAGFYMCPLKVIEWMAAGRAVVAPCQGPLRELIDDGVHGLLFPTGDADALAAAVVRLVDDPDLRRRLGRAAAERAHATLSWTDNARRVLTVCERVREGRTPPASP